MSDINTIIKQVGAIKISPVDDEKKQKRIKDVEVFGVSTTPNKVKKRKRKIKKRPPKMPKESDL
tara:strand:- start:995 stop:1186 length:192 start_codon:yes stop_codon:yes gene_type:complete